MSLLRMLAFNQSDTTKPAIKASEQVSNTALNHIPSPSASASLKAVEIATQMTTIDESNPISSAQTVFSEPIAAWPVIETSKAKIQAPSNADYSLPKETQIVNNDAVNEPTSLHEEVIEQKLEPTIEKKSEQHSLQFNGNWRSLVDTLKLGLARTLAQNCELESFDENNINLTVPDLQRHLLDPNYQEKLSTAINQHFGRKIKLSLKVGGTGNTPAKQIFQEKAAVQSEAESAIHQDDFVQALMKDFGASIIPSSIKPI